MAYHTVDKHDGERGFSLVVVLFFLGLIASIIAINALGQKGAVQQDQARAAGWHLAQVAKAARIYVRDRSLVAGDLTNHPYHKTELAAGGKVITLAELSDAGLLPENFPVTNVLGQTVSIYAANFPVNGSTGDPNTVANAYVFLNDTAETRTKPVLMQYLIEGARENGLYANAPLFDDNNVNISESCRGLGPAYASWDTNCIALSEFTDITALASFQPGSLIVPAWRSQNLDTRAVMRFPQPENPGFATMLTSLELATTQRDANGDCLQFEQVRDYNNTADPTAMIDTDLCNVDVAHNDSPGVDRRFDMINIANMQVDSIVAANQGANEVSTRYDAAGNKITQAEYASLPAGAQKTLTQGNTYGEVMVVTGNVSTEGNVWATRRQAMPVSGAYVPTVAFMNGAGTRTNLTVDKNVTIDNRGAPGLLNMRVTDSVDVSTASAKSLVNNNTTTVHGRVGAQTVDAGTLVVREDCGADCGMVSRTLSVAGDIRATNADFFSRVRADDVDITNARRSDNSATPVLVVHGAQGRASVAVNNSLSVGKGPGGGGLALDGLTTIQGDTRATICDGPACPNITEDPPDEVVYE